MNTTHLLSSFFPGQEQWLKSKSIGLSKEGNIIVSVYCDLRGNWNKIVHDTLMDEIKKISIGVHCG